MLIGLSHAFAVLLVFSTPCKVVDAAPPPAARAELRERQPKDVESAWEPYPGEDTCRDAPDCDH